MSDELRACPLCGIDGDRSSNGFYAWCVNRDCKLHEATIPFDEWQSRPLEDALLERAEHAETDAVCLRYENEALKATIENLIEAGSRVKVINQMDNDCVAWRALAAEWKEQK